MRYMLNANRHRCKAMSATPDYHLWQEWRFDLMLFAGNAEPGVAVATYSRVGFEAPVAEWYFVDSAAVLVRGAVISGELKRESITEVVVSMCVRGSSETQLTCTTLVRRFIHRL